MFYAIRILQKQIKEHKDEIIRLKNAEYEMSCDDFFCKEEIKEREQYINQLEKAIIKLNT